MQGYDRYAYSNNSPIRYTDPTGHWIESALDVAFIAYDIYDISANGLNWENGLSLAADVVGLALPVVTGGGMAVRALTHADDAVKVINTADNVIDAANAIDNAIDAGNAADNLTDIVKAVDDIPCSFSAETDVTTLEDIKDIAAIEIGDFVLAWNEADGTLSYYEVMDVLVHADPVLTELIIDGEWIETTPEHPFYVEGKGWTPAEDLQWNDEIRKADGDTGKFWVKWTVYRTQEMYNLTVDTAHTFFVGDGQWLVHNTCPPYNRKAFGNLKNDVRDFIFERDNYTCFYCNKKGGDLTIDHIYSLKNKWYDGAWQWTFEQRNLWANDIDNLVTACRSCNSSKNASTLSDWIERLLRRKGIE